MLLKGFSQIFFQENVIMGALIALGLLIASPTALLLALLGGTVSALTNKFLGFDQSLYNAGIAAFNGIIIGCAMSFYIKSLPISLLAVVVGSIIGGLIFFILVKNHITPYALPFILVTFLTVLVVKVFGIH